ncbi:hypothetical protein DSL72_008063 [Monilinia vaccinii-corymbosi]|uniref:Uncharacterized protein n=1 Tax=Monilinia vaccinii-corymbosi TaxID=61207 RepID=A0A8A3PJW5_9HELO|nr:hypothetical protein DSL72_008063 [Monilinia vaccinii-corymbosi]
MEVPSPTLSPQKAVGIPGLRRWLDLYECFDKEPSELLTQAKKEEMLDDILTFSCNCIKTALHKPQVESMEALVSIWAMFANVVQFIDWSDPFHDRLICLLLWTKEFEFLRKTVHPEEIGTRATWECHRLVEVVQNSWKELIFAPHNMVDKQCNLASFTATALAISSNDWLGIVALWYLHQALEISDLRAVRFAPVTIIWIRTAGAKLLTFSILRKKWNNENIAADALDLASMQIPGILAKLAGVTYHGFSLERWFFWKGRFERLAMNEDEETRKWASDTVGYMTQFDSMLDYGVSDEKLLEDESTLREKDENKMRRIDMGKAGKDGCGEKIIEDNSHCDGQLTVTVEIATSRENTRLSLPVRQEG